MPKTETTEPPMGGHERLLYESRLESLMRENAYLRARQAPVYFLIDRGNYSEMIQVFHPLDQKRIGDLIMSGAKP